MKKNMKLVRLICAFLTVIFLVLSFVACGGAVNKTSAEKNMSDSAIKEDASDTPVNPNSGGSALSDPLSQPTMPDNLNIKLIWNAYVSMETLKFDQSLTDINSLVGKLNGFVESSSSSGGSDVQGNYINKSASFTIRVPSEQLNGFISDLAGCGVITSQNISSENISLQYADTEARKKALQTEYDKLLELMEKAENVDAVIAVEARLSEVRLQLDSLSSELRGYDNLVDYATIHLDIYEVRKISGTNAVSIPERISNGFSNTLFGIKVFFEDLIVFLVVNIPVFLILAVVILIILLIVKRMKKRKISKKASTEMKSENSESKKE